jgi:3-hydroxyisobutyrate dehydrogenase-like beta-hydroxyacid dehydrogenase
MSTTALRAGTLTIMVGGEGEALERVRPVPDRFPAKIFHMGESGADTTSNGSAR